MISPFYSNTCSGLACAKPQGVNRSLALENSLTRGGTAGCPLAATLSQSYRVLVLERGGVPYGNPNLMNQERFLATLTEVDTFDSHAQAKDGVPNARGHILGGNSSINAGFYGGADQQFYQKSGVNWDLRVVNEPYEWVEKAVVFRPELRNWQSLVRADVPFLGSRAPSTSQSLASTLFKYLFWIWTGMLSRTGQLIFYQRIRDSYPHSVRDSPLSMSSPSLRILVRLATMPLSPIVGQWGPHPLLSLPSQQPHPRWNQTASPKNYDYDSRQFNIHTAYEFVAAQLVALFHQQKMLTGIFGIIHQLAGGVSLESQGRGYEVSFRTLPLLALLLFVCLPEKDSAEVVRSQL
ncbi:hypothetical protein QYF36_017116 [Acer negundo]|nr:hypothetical protein QYF36_017116 [Acer negundo]